MKTQSRKKKSRSSMHSASKSKSFHLQMVRTCMRLSSSGAGPQLNKRQLLTCLNTETQSVHFLKITVALRFNWVRSIDLLPLLGLSAQSLISTRLKSIIKAYFKMVSLVQKDELENEVHPTKIQVVNSYTVAWVPSLKRYRCSQGATEMILSTPFIDSEPLWK